MPDTALSPTNPRLPESAILPPAKPPLLAELVGVTNGDDGTLQKQTVKKKKVHPPWGTLSLRVLYTEDDSCLIGIPVRGSSVNETGPLG